MTSKDGDPRKEYIINCAAQLCGLSPAAQKNAMHADEVTKFLDDSRCTLLQIVSDGDSKVQYSNSSKTDPEEWTSPSTARALFVKLKPKTLTKENFRQLIQVTTMIQSPVHSLYHHLHDLYGPMVLKDPSWSGKLDRKIQKIMTVLDNQLGGALHSGDAFGEDVHNKRTIASILKPSDEFELWSSLTQNRKYRAAARTFSDAFSQISGRFQKLQSLSLADVIELIDDTQNALDDVWKADVDSKDMAFPQFRMKHLCDIVAESFGRFIQSDANLGDENLWHGPFAGVSTSLRDAMEICDRWSRVVHELTSSFWPTYSSHPWKDAPYRPTFTQKLWKRLETILRIRTTHEELLRLLPPSEQRSLRVRENFKPFAGTRPLQCNPYTESSWKRAVKEHERLLEPVEQNIASKLRSKVAGSSERATQRLRCFLQYRNLLMRPSMIELLRGEREALLRELSSHVSNLERGFESSSTNGVAPKGKDMPRIVESIVWAKQLEMKMLDIREHASKLLGDLKGFEEFKNNVEHLQSKAKRWRRDTYDKWKAKISDDLEDSDVSLRMTGRLMHFDTEGDLHVGYSDRLVQLLREVRQLRGLGYDIPRDITRAADDAEMFYRHGVLLKRIANFYNSMGTQIVATQKPMLLESLLAFEKTLKQRDNNNASKSRSSSESSKGSVTWSKPRECEDYVQRLQQAAETLLSENRKLREVHDWLSAGVKRLMALNLLRDPEKWTSQWSTLKVKMDEMKRRYPSHRIDRWVLYWDHQVYKALEAGYRWGLESLNENLPEIRCELIFTQRRLQLRPPIEELRASYFKQMRRFIEIPIKFEGFGGNKIVYQRMFDRNGSALIQVYKKADDLFDRLAALRDSMRPWTALGTIVDVDDYVAREVGSLAEFDVNFKMIKKRQKQSEKIADFHRVDCVYVSMAPFKSAIEDHMQRFGDALLLALKKSLLTHIKAVESFAEEAMDVLNTRPQSIEEIGEARVRWKELGERKKKLRVEFKRCDDKMKLLSAVAGNRVRTDDVHIRLSRLPSTWENLDIAMEAFNDMIEEEREKLKGKIDGMVVDCNVKLEKFSKRWFALKPATASVEGDGGVTTTDIDRIFEALEDWRTQFEELESEAKTLTKNCEHFQMSAPAFEGLATLEEDMDAVEFEWQQMRDYRREWDLFAEQDWINFRTKIFDLNDFVAKWVPKVRNQKGPVAAHVQAELQLLKRAVPALKYCRGDVPFNEEHWMALFHRLGIEKGVRLENLTAGHFLTRLDAVIKNERFCKELTARATGEIRIREAILELKQWFAVTEFVLFEHECLNRTTTLISEWKDLFTALGDNQSLLASLKDSPFFKPFASEATQYERQMSDLNEYLTVLNKIQRRWLYLEPIFGRGALPQEQQRFKRVDEEFRDIMGKVQTSPHVVNLCDEGLHPGLRGIVNTCLEQLERCQKALSDYLESKRSMMPRFYFIGDDDLLEILGQARNPEVIQNHLKKLFQGIHEVDFSSDKSQVVAMKSIKGEKVLLSAPVLLSDEVEKWLTLLTNEMKDTLASLLVRCLKEKTPDLSQYPSQVLCLAEAVNFTK
eukprot:g3113.t1